MALIAGAVVPDLPYFVDVPVTAESWHEPFVNATFSHSFKGALLVGLPSVVVVALLLCIARRPMGHLLPFSLRWKGDDGARGRGRFSFGTWFLISALIGLTTHVVWDSLTHGDVAVASLPFLRADLVAGLTVDRILQHASTLLGALVMVVWCVRRLRSDHLSIERIAASRVWAMTRPAIALSILLASAVSTVVSVLEVQERDGTLGLELTLSVLLKSGMRGAVVAVVVYALAWHVVSLSRRLGTQGSNP